MARALGRGTAWVAAAVAGAGTAGDVLRVGPDRLPAVIDRAGYCCVVDARPGVDRSRAPIDGALAWREDLVVPRAGAVVVVGATEDDALRIAEAIAAASAEAAVIVVQGGAEGWLGFVRERAAAPRPGMPFIIPRNTCEPGTTVMELKRGATEK